MCWQGILFELSSQLGLKLHPSRASACKARRVAGTRPPSSVLTSTLAREIHCLPLVHTPGCCSEGLVAEAGPTAYLVHPVVLPTHTGGWIPTLGGSVSAALPYVYCSQKAGVSVVKWGDWQVGLQPLACSLPDFPALKGWYVEMQREVPHRAGLGARCWFWTPLCA